MIEVQQLAEQLGNVSHRVRIACQELEITITPTDEIDADDTATISKIRKHVEAQQQAWKDRKNG